MVQLITLGVVAIIILALAVIIYRDFKQKVDAQVLDLTERQRHMKQDEIEELIKKTDAEKEKQKQITDPNEIEKFWEKK